jgi:glycosyltransferase involved in cell wall biosynthesis
MSPTISVVLPVYNEHDNLVALLGRLLPVLEQVVSGNFEVLFVNDGSHDGSTEILDSFHGCDQRIKAIHFSRNFGHQAALQAGLDESTGEAVILMDGIFRIHRRFCVLSLTNGGRVTTLFMPCDGGERKIFSSAQLMLSFIVR